jgi:hypothetical protein
LDLSVAAADPAFTGAYAPSGAQFVTLATDALLANERVLTAGQGSTIIDDGANAPVKIQSNSPHTGYAVMASQRWFNSTATSTPNISATFPNNARLFFAPIIISKNVIVDGMALRVEFAAVGDTIRLGLYTSVNEVPDSLIIDAGLVSANTTGAKAITIADTTLTPGLYFIAVAGENITTARIRRDTTATNMFGYDPARLGEATSLNEVYQIDPYTPGGLPLSATGVALTSNYVPVASIRMRT